MNATLRILSPAPATNAVTAAFDRFSAFQGVLHVAGYAFCATQKVASLALRLADGTVRPLARHDLPSPDLARLHGNMAAACAFDVRLVLGSEAGLGPGVHLEVRLADGSLHHVAYQGADPTDRMQALDARFFAMLKDRPPGHLLEIGSRARTGTIRTDLLPPGWRYTGFDIMDGENVDIVGDAHAASSFLPLRSFDAVMSFVVFEHLLMPWKAVIEMNRVLKEGAIGLIMAPQSWPLHEEPCDYFRFSAHAWKALLNRATGFEIIEAAQGGRAYMVPHALNPVCHFGEVHVGALMSGVLFRKVSETSLDWPVSMADIAEDRYPF